MAVSEKLADRILALDGALAPDLPALLALLDANYHDLNVLPPTYEPGAATCPRCADGTPLHAPGSTGTASIATGAAAS